MENSSPVAERSTQTLLQAGIKPLEIQDRIIFRKKVTELRNNHEKRPAKPREDAAEERQRRRLKLKNVLG